MKLKRIKVVHLFVIIVILMSGLLTTEQNRAYACSCSVAPGSFEEELADSDYVFDGIVTNKKEEGLSLSVKSSADPVEWTFQVNGSWKGEVTDVTTVYSATSSISCGYEFEVGKRYAVFAREVDATINVSFCSKTLLIADNSDFFTELGPYKYEFDDTPIAAHEENKTIDPSSRITDPSSILNESKEYEFILKSTTDQSGALTEENPSKDSIEKVNQSSIIAFVAVFILLIVVTGMLIYRKNRK